jgi:hypothetical protein
MVYTVAQSQISLSSLSCRRFAQRVARRVCEYRILCEKRASLVFIGTNESIKIESNEIENESDESTPFQPKRDILVVKT